MCHNGLWILALSDLSVAEATVDLAEAVVVVVEAVDGMCDREEGEDTGEEEEDQEGSVAGSVVEVEVAVMVDTVVEEVDSPLPLLPLAPAGGRGVFRRRSAAFRLDIPDFSRFSFSTFAVIIPLYLFALAISQATLPLLRSPSPPGHPRAGREDS